MRGKKTLLCDLVDAFGIGGALSAVTRRMRPGLLPILAYHRVLDFDPAAFPFEESNVSAGAGQFFRQMQYVGDHFTPLVFSELGAMLDSGRTLPPNPILITFDDGYRDNYQVAYDILRNFKLKATFFVTVDYIGTDRIYDFEKLTFALKTTSVRLADLNFMGAGELVLRTREQRRQARNRLIHLLRQIDPAAQRRHLERLFRTLRVTVPDALGRQLIMDWRHLREMARDGMEIGSHSLTHPILARLAGEELKAEIAGSKHKLEQMLDTEVVSFCYPAGGKSDYFGRREIDAVRAAGYRFGVSFVNGLNHCGRLDSYSLRRLRISRYLSLGQFKMGLTLPAMLV